MENTKRKLSVLLIGGSGFVGRAILRELSDENCPLAPKRIRLFDISQPPLDVMENSVPFEYLQGDIRNSDELDSACEGMDVVIHLASIVDWGTHPESEVHDVNVNGTSNVIDACTKTGVDILVYTSSLDAIFAGKPIIDADETYPYPSPFINAYSRTKAAAEQLVVKANSAKLKTVVLRPSGIYGEADPYHLHSLVIMAKSGPFIKIGNGKSKCMHIYSGNVAHGHLLAASAIVKGNLKPAGQIYFLVDSKPENFFDCLCPVLKEAQIPMRPQNLWIPAWFLYPAALAAEGFAFMFRPIVRLNPALSRFALKYISTNFTLNGEKAFRDFGFRPKYQRDEAVKNSAVWFSSNKASQP